MYYLNVEILPKLSMSQNNFIRVFSENILTMERKKDKIKVNENTVETIGWEKLDYVNKIKKAFNLKQHYR